MRVERRRVARFGRFTRDHRSMRPVDANDLARLRRRAARRRDGGLSERRNLRPDAPQHVRRARGRAGARALARSHRYERVRSATRRPPHAARAAFAEAVSSAAGTHRADALDDRGRQPRARRARVARGRRDRHDRRRASGSRRAARRARAPPRRRRAPGAGARRRAIPRRRSRRSSAQRTRLVAVSHVLWGTGQVLPLPRLASAARAQGALLLVDGAQSVGAIEVDPLAEGADLYTISGQKWLLGPSGTGALWVREGLEDELALAQPGYLSRDMRVRGDAAVAGRAPLRRRVAGPERACADSWSRSASGATRSGWAGGLRACESDGRPVRATCCASVPRRRARRRPPGRCATLVTFTVDGPRARGGQPGARGARRAGALAHEPKVVRISVGFWTSDETSSGWPSIRGLEDLR